MSFWSEAAQLFLHTDAQRHRDAGHTQPSKAAPPQRVGRWTKADADLAAAYLQFGYTRVRKSSPFVWVYQVDMSTYVRAPIGAFNGLYDGEDAALAHIVDCSTTGG